MWRFVFSGRRDDRQKAPAGLSVRKRQFFGVRGLRHGTLGEGLHDLFAGVGAASGMGLIAHVVRMAALTTGLKDAGHHEERGTAADEGKRAGSSEASRTHIKQGAVDEKECVHLIRTGRAAMGSRPRPRRRKI